MALQMQSPVYPTESSFDKASYVYSDSVFSSRENLTGTLVELLHTASTSKTGFTIYNPGQGHVAASTFSYQQLLAGSEEKARLLRHVPGLSQNKIILLHFDNHIESIEWFWAAICSDLLPAISTPFSTDAHQRQQHLLHLKGLLDEPIVLTSRKFVPQFSDVSTLSVHTVEALKNSVNGNVSPRISCNPQEHTDRPAVLMLTSGSTGNAKAVPLTVPQMISSIRGKSESWNTNTRSVFLNWIGLDHVANLTEIHLHAMLLMAGQVHVQAHDLLSDPLLFLRLIDKHRVTHTFAPNFFLAMLEKRLTASSPSDPIFSLDLSCLQSIMSGGEANVVLTAVSLTQRLNTLKAQGQIIRLGYGLTEACAALMYDTLDPAYEERERHEFASIGKPIRGAMVRIRTDTEKLAESYEVGSLEISGPVLFKGYFNDVTSSAKAFTDDGWFITGDRAYIDSSGKVNLSGRSKEVIVINGVKYLPQDIESAIERAALPSIAPSYVATFSNRPQGSETEEYCIVYGSVPNEDGRFAKVRTADSISRITSALVGVRPAWIIPLHLDRLHKSSLGKLSRTKLQKDFEKGLYDDERIETVCAIREYVSHYLQKPETEIEKKIVQVLSEMLELPTDAISVDRTIFEVGITSITLFRFEQQLRKHLDLGSNVSIITFLSNPIIRAIANAIENEHSHQYDPVVQLQGRGAKSPLWLVHPASGNVLAFLPLARTLVDRPLYALTARGFNDNETMFSSIAEMSDTYFKHVKKTQPEGPYALTGYSLGTTVAYELAKRLEANGDEVAFCAALDSPPHVIPLVEHLDWTSAAVLVSYFIELIPQTQVPDLIPILRSLSKEETIRRLLEVARPAQRELLNLDVEQLLAIVNVTDNFGTMAKSYMPQGMVTQVDVFYCTPLHYVEKNREKWIEGHLIQWQDFSRETVEFHECEGDHADMLNPEYVKGFEQRLTRVLAARGI